MGMLTSPDTDACAQRKTEPHGHKPNHHHHNHDMQNFDQLRTNLSGSGMPGGMNWNSTTCPPLEIVLGPSLVFAGA